MKAIVRRNQHEARLRQQKHLDNLKMIEATKIAGTAAVVDNGRPSTSAGRLRANQNAGHLDTAAGISEIQNFEQRLRPRFFVLSPLKEAPAKVVQRFVSRQRVARGEREDLTIAVPLRLRECRRDDSSHARQHESGEVAAGPTRP